MSRWFRFYDDAVNDPKLIKLPDDAFRAWVNLLCAASKNEGVLPSTEDVAILLRIKTSRAAAIIAELVTAGLLDKIETGFAPHNWDVRQFKSDVSKERVQRYRQRKRNVTSPVTVTSPDTDNRNRSRDSGAIAPDAGASDDPRARLFRDGLAKLAMLTGKGPDACRSFVGKCLKAAGDDAVIVLGLIEDAERNHVVDPSAWIAARLKPTGIPNGKTLDNPRAGSLIGAIDRELAKLELAEKSDLALPADHLLRLSQ